MIDKKDLIEISIIIIIIVVVRLSILEPFRVPSGSMKPNLLSGDFVFTNKFIFYSNIIDKKILKKPQKGDIIMFKKDKVKYVKRVINVPESMTKYKNKQIFINKIKIKKKLKNINNNRKSYKIYNIKELLTSQKEYLIRNNSSKNKCYDLNKIKTNNKEYFVAGDNRDNSEDSRDINAINFKNIKGKVMKIWLSLDLKNIDIRWNRFLKTVK